MYYSIVRNAENKVVWEGSNYEQFVEICSQYPDGTVWEDAPGCEDGITYPCNEV